MGHGHAHGHGLTGRKLGWAIGLTLLFVAGEGIAGAVSHSLALMSDAGHNFADALALVLTAYALWIARKPADASRTYGFHRVGILVALANAVALVGIALLIFWEAVQRLSKPEPVHSGPMIGVAVAAIGLNAVIAVWLHGDAKHDLNVRSAYLHMAGDAVSALGVVVAGIIVACTGNSLADPAVSLIIGALILWSSWGILTESVSVLLESVPVGMDLTEVTAAIGNVQGVVGVHHLHVWTVASGMVACSCHVVVADQSVASSQEIRLRVAGMLCRDFRIGHATLQIEVDECADEHRDCGPGALRAAEPHGHGHGDAHTHSHGHTHTHS